MRGTTSFAFIAAVVALAASTLCVPSAARPLEPVEQSAYRAPQLTDALTQAQYKQAKDLYDAKRYHEALQAFLAPAERGDSRAQAMLGNIHHLGRGQPIEHAKALHWYQLAARQGNRQAEFFLGEMYGEGEGVARDFARSAELYRAAARKGLAAAQAALGLAYEFGEGVPRERGTAIHWLRRAARQGNGGAGWIAEWLINPRTPHFQNSAQLGAYANAKVSAWASAQGGAGGAASSSGTAPGGGASGGGCSHSSYAACNAEKAGDRWAADRIERNSASGSERAWYGR